MNSLPHFLNFVQKALSTERLTLEPITVAHAEELCELFNDPELHRFTPQECLTLEKQEERCARWEKRASPDGLELWLNWAARDKNSKKIIAHLQAGIKSDQEASIGYLVAKHFQNKGYATEALGAVFLYLEEELKVTEVKAWSDTRNLASHRLAEKMGMVKTEVIKNADFFKGVSSDEFLFLKKFE